MLTAHLLKPVLTLTITYWVAKEAVAMVSSCVYLPWMMLVQLFLVCVSTAFHTCQERTNCDGHEHC